MKAAMIVAALILSTTAVSAFETPSGWTDAGPMSPAASRHAHAMLAMFKSKMPCPVKFVTFLPAAEQDVYHITCDFSAVKHSPKPEAIFDLSVEHDAPFEDVETATEKLAEFARVAMKAIEDGKNVPHDGGFEIEVPRKRGV